MESIITINGLECGIKATMGTLWRYKTQFKSDMLVDVQRSLGDSNMPEFTVILKILWALLKTSNQDVAAFEVWADNVQSLEIDKTVEIITTAIQSLFNSKNSPTP